MQGLLADKCEQCKFYEDAGQGIGLCRRYPPVLIVTPDANGRPTEMCKFAMTGPTQWCGEFKIKIMLMS